MVRHASLLGSLLALLALGACQNVLNPAETPAFAASAARNPAPNSAQRLDASGFPQLGAFPNSAAPQLEPATVVRERNRLLAQARARAGLGSPAGEYDAALNRAAAVRQDQRLAVDRALPGNGGAGAAAPRTPAN